MSEKLPTVGSGAEGFAAEGAPESSNGSTTRTAAAPQNAPPARPRASSPRLVATLAVAGAVAGFFIVLVHQWSQPKIQAYQAKVLIEAVQEVLGGPDRTETYFLHEGRFTAAPPADADTSAMDRVYVGFNPDGSPMGVAAAAGEPGFQDIIRLIFGYDPNQSTVLGMKVLESKETPGLGDKIEKDSTFVAEFRSALAPLVGVKSGKATGSPHEVDMITGATISSQAIVDIINNRLDVLDSSLDRLWQEGTAVAAGQGEAAAPEGAGGPSPERADVASAEAGSTPTTGGTP